MKGQLYTQDNSIISQLNGIVLHILIQKQDRRGEMANGIDVDEFKELCTEIIHNNTNIISSISTNAIIGVFAEEFVQNPELLAAKIAYNIREKLYKCRKQGLQLILKACINTGKIIIGSSLGNDEYEVLGNAINSSFQLIDTTHPMQISVTRKIKQKISDEYNLIPRRPIDIGLKRAQLYYLHIPISENNSIPQNF